MLPKSQIVNKVVRYLMKGSREDVEGFLPIELWETERSSTECLRLAEAVEKKFEEVMFLTGELLEASSAAKGHYKKAQDEAKLNREIVLAKQKKELQRMKDTKKQQKKLEKQVREAKRTWERAVDSMPSGWSLFGMQFVEGLTNTFSALLQAVVPFAALQRGGKKVYARLQTIGDQTKPTGSTAPNTARSAKQGRSSKNKTTTVSCLGIQVSDLSIQRAECLDSVAGKTDDNKNLNETIMRSSKNKTFTVSHFGININDLMIQRAECLDCSAGKTDDNKNISETLMRSSEDKTPTVSLLGIQVKNLVILMAECLDSAARKTDDNKNLSETLMRIRLLSKNLSADVRADSASNKEIKKILEEKQQICHKGEA